MLKKSFLIITFISVLFSGCQTYEPAVVSNGKISNPTVGYNGYDARTPPGYIQYNHEKMSKNHSMGETIHALKENRDIIGAYYEDQIILVSPDFAILFTVSQVDLPTKYRRLNDIGNVSTSSINFSHLQDHDKQLFLSEWANSVENNGKIVKQDVVDLSNTPTKHLYAGRVVTEYPSVHLVLVDYFTLGKGNEMFIISGAGPAYKLDQISSDVEFIIRNLDIK